MSIATRITSIEEHIENTYDKLDDLGIDLTDVDKNIDNIADMLEDVWQEYPKVTGEGTEVTLEGTKVGKIGIDIKGNSVQDSEPTPDNPIPINSAGDNVNIFDVDTPYASPNKAINDDGVITTASGYSVYKVPLKANTTYTFQKNNTATAYIRIVLMNSNDIKESLVVSGNMSTIGIYTKTFTTTSATAYAYIQRKITDENVKLVEGINVGGYSPYNMGCITEKIVNGNYLKNSVESQTINGITITKNADDSMTIDGTTTASFTVVLNPVSNPVYLKAGTYRFNLKGRVQSVNNLEVYNTAGTRVAVIQGSTVYQSTQVTFEEDVIIGRVITYFNAGKTLDNVTMYLSITKGSAEVPYVKHQEQNFIIPTQQPMRRMEKGIFQKQDFFFKNTINSPFYDNTLILNKWYEKHIIHYYKFSGEENWLTASSIVEGTTRFYISKEDVKNQQGAVGYVFSNRFIPLSWNQMYSTDTTTKNAISNYNQYNTAQTRIVIRIDNNIASTKEQLNTYFSNNDAYAIYEAVEPTNLPCTAEQTQVLEALLKAKSYEDTTIIYSEDITPAYLNATALKGA